jgi:hypothetical protein
LGDTDPLDQRRAKATEILSEPALADKLLQVAQYLAAHPEATTRTPADADDRAPDSAAPADDPADVTSTDDTAAATRSASASSAASAAADAADDDDPADDARDAGAAPHSNTTDAATASDHTSDHAASDHAATDAIAATDAAATDVVTSTNGAGQGRTDPPTQTDQPAETAEPAEPAETVEASEASEASPAADDAEPEVTSDGQLASDLFMADEPGTNTDADRDTPHPSQPGHPLDQRQSTRPPGQAGSTATKELIYGMGAAGRHDLAARLAAIKHAADTNTATNTGTTGIGSTGIGNGSSRRRPGRTKLYIHLTGETLLAGGGITRVEGFGPVFAPKLAELLGHDHITVQPVIDLNEHINVNAYEIPQRLRERIKLTFPVEQFPYGPGETTNSTDLDHIQPFDPTGPPGQTSTTTLQPLRRISHRVKTHAPGWTVERIDAYTIEWTTPHGYKFHVDNAGTRLVAEPLRTDFRLGGEAE